MKSIDSRLTVLEDAAGQVNNCPECKDYNNAAHAWEFLVKSGKHLSEVEIPDYVCPTCGKVPVRDDKAKMDDYGKFVLAANAHRSIWETNNHEQ